MFIIVLCASANVHQPSSFSIWEQITAWFNERIKKMGVKNCSFPLFISEANLQREKDHIEGFAAEVAWVTHAYVGLCCSVAAKSNLVA